MGFMILGQLGRRRTDMQANRERNQKAERYCSLMWN
jgi:hypothetical protein